MARKLAHLAVLIDGMTCVNCELRIENTLKNTSGIELAEVNFSKSIGSITYDANIINKEQIKNIIESMDYHVRRPSMDAPRSIQPVKTASNRIGINKILGTIIIMAAVYMIVSRVTSLGIFNAFPVAEQGMGYGLIFVIGLLTSIHCVAMCGGINISQTVAKQVPVTEAKLKFAGLRPGILYNAGRVISYTVIGGVVGALGSVISFSGWAKGIVAVIAGLFMIIMGLNMLNIFPWLKKFNPRIPKIFAGKINTEKQQNSNRPLYIGLLNGLIPCGPLQAMQLYALSTGSPVKGALSMLLFSLGTVPLMFGLGALSSFLNKKFTKKMIQVSAALVVVLGIFMFQNGMSLSGLSISSLSGILQGTNNAVVSDESDKVIIEEGVQVINTSLSSGRYTPITVQVGVPVRWTINAPQGSVNGCNNVMVIPEYGIEKELLVGDNVITFIPAETGTFPYSCWMGMIRSKITVTGVP